MFQTDIWRQSPERCIDNDASSCYSSSSSSSSSFSPPFRSPPLVQSSLPPSTLPTSSSFLSSPSYISSSLSLLDDPSFTDTLPELLEDALSGEEPNLLDEDQFLLYALPPSAPPTTTTTDFTTLSSTPTTCSFLPQTCDFGCVSYGGSNSFLPTSVVSGDPCSLQPDADPAALVAAAAAVVAVSDGGEQQRKPDELDKARRRQIKAQLRKERNKEAARRSNYNKKLIRDQLEKKSVELWEENLQLHQDIRDLTDKLRHFRQVHSSMHHVCHKKHLSRLRTCR
ncbi:uncharacterized protein LOC143293464 [Babylonia areolata]|uniref:uncharacterized protein LOC143293464 n=1 Tax=Babylonia areolata TaxID=304850 RepID=UPI003FD64885